MYVFHEPVYNLDQFATVGILTIFTTFSFTTFSFTPAEILYLPKTLKPTFRSNKVYGKYAYSCELVQVANWSATHT